MDELSWHPPQFGPESLAGLPPLRPDGREVTIPVGEWWRLDGRPGEGELVILLADLPALDAADPTLVAVSGWRLRDDQPGPEWLVLLVRRDSEWTTGRPPS